MIVDILVAQSQTQNTLSHQVLAGVLYQQRIAVIGEAICKSAQNAAAFLYRLKQEQAPA